MVISWDLYMPVVAPLPDEFIGILRADFIDILRDIFTKKGQLDIASRNAKVAFLDGNNNPLALSTLDEAGVFDEHGQINDLQCKRLNITFNERLMALNGYKTFHLLSDRERLIMTAAIEVSTDKLKKICQHYLVTKPNELPICIDLGETFQMIRGSVIEQFDQCLFDAATDSHFHLMTSPSSTKLIDSVGKLLNSSTAISIDEAEKKTTLRRRLEIAIRCVPADTPGYVNIVKDVINRMNSFSISVSDASKLRELNKALDFQVAYHAVTQEMIKQNVDKDPMDGIGGVRENIFKQIANIFPEDEDIFDSIKDDSMLLRHKASSAKRAAHQAFEDSDQAMNEKLKKKTLDMAKTYSKISSRDPDEARYDVLVSQIKDDLGIIDTNIQTNFFRMCFSFKDRLNYFNNLKIILNEVLFAYNLFSQVAKTEKTHRKEDIEQLHSIVDKRLAEIKNPPTYKAKIFLEQAEAYISSPERHWNTGYQWKKHRLIIGAKEYSIPKHVAKQLEEIAAAKKDDDYVTHMQNFINIGTKQANSFFKCFSSKSSKLYSTLFAHSNKKADIELENKLLEAFSTSHPSSK